jgi:surface antigen
MALQMGKSGRRPLKWLLILLGALGLAVLVFSHFQKVNPNPNRAVGQVIDELNGVAVYYNGGVGHTEGRNLAADGYNLGIKYQCVEFVKRYYHERLRHKMPDTYGNAKDFFDAALADGELNTKRDLLQYRNPSANPPEDDDLLVFAPTLFNPYGHVAIVAKASEDAIVIVQQNPGPFAPSRLTIPLRGEGAQWRLENERILGWLRMKNSAPRRGLERSEHAAEQPQTALASPESRGRPKNDIGLFSGNEEQRK